MDTANTSRPAPIAADTALEEFRIELDRKWELGEFKTTDYPKEYKAWWNAQQRVAHRKTYRGIYFEHAWREPVYGFYLFVRYVGLAPTRQHSLDRIKPWRGYEYGNLQWATLAQQDENKRRHYIEWRVDGSYGNISQLARRAPNGISREGLRKRVMQLGMLPEVAVTLPLWESLRSRPLGAQRAAAR